jgi:hypothetical protein
MNSARFCGLLALAALLPAAASPGFADSRHDYRGWDRRLTVNFTRVPLHKALRRIYHGTHIEYAAWHEVREFRVTLHVRHMLLRKVERLLVRSVSRDHPRFSSGDKVEPRIYSLRPPPTAEAELSPELESLEYE